MLTATYSLVAIANEQKILRRTLHGLQQCIRNAWSGLQHIDQACVQSAINHLSQFDEYCRHGRKVQTYLIPALRRMTGEANALLAELEALSAMGRYLLGSAKTQLRRALEVGDMHFGEPCKAMELYCRKLLNRLAKEEDELFPLVRRVLTIDDWFLIAEKFLSVDGQTYRGKWQSQPLPLLPTAQPLRDALHRH
jgi:hemerythrin-like domain-containing protein